MTHFTNEVLSDAFMESLDFTDTQKQLDALKAIIFDITEANTAKIEFIKEELANDRYQIRNHHIAEQMLEYTIHYLEEEVEMV